MTHPLPFTLCVNVTNTNDIMTSKYTLRLSNNNSVCDVKSIVIQLDDVKNKHLSCIMCIAYVIVNTTGRSICKENQVKIVTVCCGDMVYFMSMLCACILSNIVYIFSQDHQIFHGSFAQHCRGCKTEQPCIYWIITHG